MNLDTLDHPVDGYELEAPGRKSLGRYYTPGPLVEQLIRHALRPAIDEARRAPDPAAAILALRVCDPACGTGRLLRAAGNELTEAMVAIRQGGAARARAEVVGQCLFGTDIDPAAARLCRESLADLAGGDVPTLREHVRTADALGETHAGEFDVVLANPPFVNGIEGAIDRTALRERFPIVTGAADLAHYFLAASMQLVREGGRLGIILPRPALNAPPTIGLRRLVTRGEMRGLRPNLLFVPDRSDLFGGALIFACAVVLGPSRECVVSLDGMTVHRGVVDSDNWWLAAHDIAEGASDRIAGTRVGDAFDVRAGMTTGEAYAVVPSLVDDSAHGGPRLITTGLIDPNVCHWGERRCRYLRRDYQFPRIARGAALSPALNKRIEQSARPKVLVAGLSRKIEAFVDARGECAGAVSTFAIFHPSDDVAALRRLADHLHGPAAHAAFRRELGANAVGGGDTVMKKAFLQSLPYDPPSVPP